MFPGIRAALVHGLRAAQVGREHNNSNVLVLDGGVTRNPMAEQIMKVWLQTPFAGDRHQRRVDKIGQVEQDLGTRFNEET